MAKLSVTLDTDTHEVQINESLSSLETVTHLVIATMLAGRLFMALLAKARECTVKDNDVQERLETMMGTIRGFVNRG